MRAMSISPWPRRRKRFAEWSKTPAAERSRILLRIADLIERDLEKFARAESIDTGKPISLARTLDIPRAASNFRFFATAILHTEIGSAHHRWRRVQLHTASAARHRRIDFAVESAALFVELENRARHRGREHRHRQTERADADDGVLALRNLRAKPACRTACSMSSTAPDRMSALPSRRIRRSPRSRSPAAP